MKRILFCLIIITSIVTNAQNISDVIGVENEYVSRVDGLKGSLYIKAMAWATSNNPDRYVTVETEDKESGTIIVSITNTLPKKDGVCIYSEVISKMNAKIDCRDNKYRIIFSNFTANVSADRSVNTDYLGTSELELMIKELEMVARISETRFNEKSLWGFDSIVSSKKHYEDIVKNFKEEMAQFDSSSKKGIKEISKREKWIIANQKYITYLDYILKGFGIVISDAVKSLDKYMTNTDDF
jgi:hypothetical protein